KSSYHPKTGMRQAIAAVLLSIFCLVCAERAAWAETTGPDVRDAPTSLPGVVRVGIPAPMRAGLAAAGTAGYGFTESVLAGSDKSHRIFGSAAASYRVGDWFAAALRFDGRYDWHTGVPDGNGGGAIGEPRLAFRAATGNDWRVGAEAGVRFPGERAPSVSFMA